MAGGSLRWRRGRGRGRSGAGRPGLRRWRLDPDPGLVLRARRPQAHARADQWSPHLWRPGGFATPGSIARTVRDAAAMLDVLAGRRVGDPSWAPPPSERFLSSCDRDPGRLRIARFITPVITDTPVDPECVQAWEDASRLLESLGHEVVDVAVLLPPEAVPVFETCWAVLTALRSCRPSRSTCCARSPVGSPRGAAPSAARSSAGRSGGAPLRRRRADRARAVRRRAHADARDPAPEGRRDPRRRGPAGRLRGPEGLHPVDLAWNVTGMPAACSRSAGPRTASPSA